MYGTAGPTIAVHGLWRAATYDDKTVGLLGRQNRNSLANLRSPKYAGFPEDSCTPHIVSLEATNLASSSFLHSGSYQEVKPQCMDDMRLDQKKEVFQDLIAIYLDGGRLLTPRVPSRFRHLKNGELPRGLLLEVYLRVAL